MAVTTDVLVDAERPSESSRARAIQSARVRQLAIRTLVLANLGLGAWYLAWRYSSSVNWHFWPLAVLLLAAETYSFVGTTFFGIGMWRWRRRYAYPLKRGDETVDVFITTYNEPVEVVRKTVRAAMAVRHPARVYVCDDGNDPAMRAMTAEEQCGYLTRSEEWDGKERHAKAGNLINALNQTSGEFVLVLDADQKPLPGILDETLGYFRDPKVAFVQTPQWFENVPPGDPLGSQAPLFYGPIQEAKDGWNASFFCGSNAVLRRDALVYAGLVDYARELEGQIHAFLDAADRSLSPAERQLRKQGDHRSQTAVAMVREAVEAARREMRDGEPLAEVTYRFQRRAQAAARTVVDLDRAVGDAPAPAGRADDESALVELTGREHSPLREIGPIRDLLIHVDVDRSHEAVPVMPLSTISVTEDLSTAMRLHSLGYTSVYHPNILAHGLAPEDLRAAMQQRLRWAQGTLQVMLRENPLTYPGLALSQRMMYFSTMWSYLFGVVALVYLAAPILFLLFGWTPVEAYTGEFLLHLLPYLVANQLLFVVVSWGLSTWRGQQFNLALFPVWIEALVSTVANTWFGRRLDFVVTPKQRQGNAPLSIIRWQLAAAAALVLAIAVGMAKLAVGDAEDRVPLLFNILWALYDVALLSVVFWAFLHRGAAAEAPEQTPAGLADGGAVWRPRGVPTLSAVPAAPAARIDAKVESRPGGVAVVRLQGRLDSAAAAAARRGLNQVVAAGYRRLVIDLHDVDYLDSSGLLSLINGLKATRQVGGDLRIARADAAAGPVIEMADLDRVFRIYPTVEEAVAAYRA